MTKRIGILVLAMVLVVGAVFVAEGISQPADNGGAAAGGQGGRGGRNFDPAAFRQRMTERLKTELGLKDDEWKVIEPKIEKVLTAQADARFGGMGGLFGRGGNRGNRGGDNATSRPAPTSETGKASAELAKVLADKEAKSEQVKTALQALRDAKAKAKASLEAAQKDLREVLTTRQEAQLVMMGMLE